MKERAWIKQSVKKQLSRERRENFADYVKNHALLKEQLSEVDIDKMEVTVAWLKRMTRAITSWKKQ